jgi:hypothetical protein
LHNKPSGSQDASCGEFYWYDIPSCPKRSYGLAGKMGQNNTSVISLSGDYVIRLHHNDGK